jgi:dihydropyrimidinase
MHSAADFDLFEGIEVTGWPSMTISRGEVVFADGEVRAVRGRGRFVHGHSRSESHERSRL